MRCEQAGARPSVLQVGEGVWFSPVRGVGGVVAVRSILFRGSEEFKNGNNVINIYFELNHPKPPEAKHTCSLPYKNPHSKHIHPKALHRNTPTHRLRRKVKHAKPVPGEKLPGVCHRERVPQRRERLSISAVLKRRSPDHVRPKRRRNVRLDLQPDFLHISAQIRSCRCNRAGRGGHPVGTKVEVVDHDERGGAARLMHADVSSNVAEQDGASAVTVLHAADVDTEGASGFGTRNAVGQCVASGEQVVGDGRGAELQPVVERPGAVVRVVVPFPLVAERRALEGVWVG